MDGQRFDDLARALVAMGSGAAHRRRLFGLVAGGALPSLLSDLPGARAEKSCRLVNQKCERHRDCCENAYCRKGKCHCKVGHPDLDHDGICTSPCEPGGNPCVPDVTQCCGGSTCTGMIQGRQVCCGLLLHECDTGGGTPVEFCCSGACGGNGRCARLPS